MKFNLTSATCIVIANMVGTGVFTSLGFQLVELNNINSILTLWILGGVVAFLGSYCYAELSATYPRSGGEYHFLRLSMGNGIGFLSGWVSIIVGFAAPIAAAAFAFADYSARLVTLPFSKTIISILIILISTLIQSLRFQISAGIQVVLTIGKVILLIFFIVAGWRYSNQHDIFIQELSTNWNWNDFIKPGFWVGLIFVSYAYTGWNASSYIIEDIKNPIKNVPRSIFIGTLLVAMLYILINWMFLMTTPAAVMKGKIDVAHESAQVIFGKTGAGLVSGMISFFLISTIGSLIIVGPRVIKRMATDYHEFAFFSKDNQEGIPIRAILFQSGIAIALILTSSFEFVITAIGFVLSIFTTLTAIGLIILRTKQPELERKIKVPLYPLTPLLFIFFNIWTMAFLIFNKPMVTIAGVIFILFGLLIYFMLNRSKKQDAQ